MLLKCLFQMSLLIDIHSHLDHYLLINKVDDIVARAKNAGLKHIITNGINPETNRICLELSKKYDIIKCGMGVYPRDALKKEVETGEAQLEIKDFDIDEEIDFIKKNKNDIVAVSEVGLDFVNGESPQQIEDFQKMINLSEQLSKPIVIHSRKAEAKCIEMLESSKNNRQRMVSDNSDKCCKELPIPGECQIDTNNPVILRNRQPLLKPVQGAG